MLVGGQRHAPAALLPEKRPGTHCTGGWVDPQLLSGRVRKILPPPRFDTRTVQTVANRYTDWAIPASVYTVYRIQMLCVITTLYVPNSAGFRAHQTFGNTNTAQVQGVSVFSLMQISEAVRSRFEPWNRSPWDVTGWFKTLTICI
jgi:hypothetical protein